MNLLHISFCVGFIYHRQSWKDQVRKCRHLDVNRCVNNFLGPVTSTWNNENNFLFGLFLNFQFGFLTCHLGNDGNSLEEIWLFSLFCCWSADRSSARSVVTIIICHTHTTRWIYSLRNNKWRHIFFSFSFWLDSFVVVMKMIQVVREGDGPVMSAGSRPHLSPGVSYTVENKVLICNLVILSTRNTQQDEDESESETSHKPNGMWVHQKQIEKIKGESRKKTRSACAADTGAVLHKSKCRASVKRKLTQRDREMLHSYAYIIPYSSASERGPW
jgi:hypothetical protein